MVSLLEYLGLEDSGLRELEQDRFYSGLGLDKGGVVLVKGLPRSGKSTWGVTTAYMRRKLYGYPVVSNVLLKPAFGEYTYLNTERLVEEFQKVNKAVEKEAKRSSYTKELSAREAKVAESAWEGSDVSLYKSTIIFDEGYGSMDRRRFMSPKLILLSYVVQQWGHFGSLIIIMASSDRLLDDIRINPFATHEVTCSHFSHPDWPMSRYRVFYRYMPTLEGVNPRTQEIFVKNWSDLFDSWCPVAVDHGILKSVLKEHKM